MTVKKIDPLTTLKGEQGLDTRNAAIVYLNKEKDYEPDTLAKLTELAVSTIKNYIRKFAHLLDWAKEIFTKGKNYITKQTDSFWCYIDKITMRDGSMLCKIGQTTRTPEKRANEILYKGWRGFCPQSVEVVYAVECKDATAMQNMEDCLRIGMTNIDPSKYLPNDRLNCWEDTYPERILNNEFVKLGLPKFAIN